MLLFAIAHKAVKTFLVTENQDQASADNANTETAQDSIASLEYQGRTAHEQNQ
jgi:hypothetical protein